MNLSADAHAEGMSLTLSCPLHPESDLHLNIRVQNKIHHQLTVRGAVESHWPMISGICGIFRSDPFRLTNGHALRYLLDHGDTYNKSVDETQRLIASPALSKLHQVLKELAVHTVSICHQETLKLARRFAGSFRFRIYQEILADPSGRVGQTVHSCPGALLFALALREKGGISALAANGIIEDIRAGKPINKALDAAIEIWTSTAIEWIQESGNKGEPNPAWERVFTSTPQEVAKIKRDQRLLVRRAGPMVPPTTLWLPPPIVFAPEDIPKKVIANKLWYKVMKSKATLNFGGVEERRTRMALSEFASKNFVALKRFMLEGRDLNMNWILDYALAERCFPTRNTAPQAFLNGASTWHRIMVEIQDVQQLYQELDLAEHPNANGYDVPLTRLDYIPNTVPEVTFTGLESAKALIHEGNQMHHCVASMAPKARNGKRLYFRANINGVPLTVEVHHNDGHFLLGEAKRKANRDPSKDQRFKLQEFIQVLNEARPNVKIPDRKAPA